MSEFRQSCRKSAAIFLISVTLGVSGFNLIDPSPDVALASAVEIYDVAFAQDRPIPPAEEPPTIAAPAGMTIHIDPQTGAILEGPAPGSVPLQMTPDLQNALSTSDQGLVEALSSVQGGGVFVDLQGRFQSPLVGTIDSSGKLKIQHLHRPPTSGERKEVNPRSTER